MGKACGNPDCNISTGLHEGLTFGSGDLDHNGYWEYPCEKCARAWEKHRPHDAPCWPFGINRAKALQSEMRMLASAKNHIAKVLMLLKDLTEAMTDRKKEEEGDEPYRRTFSAKYDEEFIRGDVINAIAIANDELNKVVVPSS
jgi:hypothetical protein